MKKTLAVFIFVGFISLVLVGLTGCAGYSDQWLYTDDVHTVYVEMFDSLSFRRGAEYNLTDALVKRIEAETPYKVISNRNKAESLITGYLTSVGESVLAGERETGLPLEKQVKLVAVISWKNLKTGEFLIEKQEIAASATYSGFQDQSLGYAQDVAANKLAELIVEAMQVKW